MNKLRCRSIRVEFLDEDNLRTETHKSVFKVPYFLAPKKTPLAKYLKIEMNRKWVMEACFYGGSKYVFTNKAKN